MSILDSIRYLGMLIEGVWLRVRRSTRRGIVFAETNTPSVPITYDLVRRFFEQRADQVAVTRHELGDMVYPEFIGDIPLSVQFDELLAWLKSEPGAEEGGLRLDLIDALGTRSVLMRAEGDKVILRVAEAAGNC